MHLHMHTEYSLLDGANRLKDLVKKIKELGMKSVAITDHGNMFGVIELYKLCKAEGIKLIVGCECYVAKRSRFDKEAKLDSEPNHLILLAQNEVGYRNLIKMVSLSYTEGFYYKPRIDKELLKQYNEGLICLSACLAGEVPRKIINNDLEGAKEAVKEFLNIFSKDRYFLEIQPNGLREQILVNQNLINIAKELDVSLVATNDCHYLTKEDYNFHEILLCIQTKKTLTDTDRMSFNVNEYYIKSKEEMISYFKNNLDAITNTTKIADMCNLEFDFSHTILPEFKTGLDISNYEYFKRLCVGNIKERYGDKIEKNKYNEIITRLKYELEVIQKMGYIDYFLIVADFIKYARENDIPVGPGRGSGAGSICAYLSNITDIDPLRFNLIFERFLNPERVSMPDFDIDFCYERRNEVIDYVSCKYTPSNVAQIITFGTMAARAAVRDVGRVLDMPYAKLDMIAKMIPSEVKMTIDKALEMNKELSYIYETDEEVKNLIDIAKKAEGLPRHASTHAAGIVITKERVDSYVPLYLNQNTISTQYTMTTLEELGLLKMDFLGLRTLTVIDDTKKMVKKNKNIVVKFDKMMNDQNVFKLLCEGKTVGVFQLESTGITNMTKQLKPDKLEDIIVLLSLYRPGPRDQIPRYIANKNSSNISYTHKSLIPILNTTNGCMVYQEQVMQIFRDLAGYSLGRADLVRRAMSKKKIDVMNKERAIFVKGCLNNNIDEVSSNKIFDEMASFAKYAFNKSHAAAYATVAYETAYLKTYYKCEFMAATMNSMLGNLNKIPEYILECKKLDIKVLKPDINKSLARFTVSDDSIIFALSTIKNISETAINEIIRLRDEDGIFTSFADFLERVSSETVNKKCIESLIYAGAFDELDKNINRFDMLESFEKLMDSINTNRRKNYANQLDFFSGETGISRVEIPKSGRVPTKNELLEMEKEIIGIYVSGHPLSEYEEYMNKNSTATTRDIIENKEKYDNKTISICGSVDDFKIVTTKNSSQMMFASLSDMFLDVELIVFPKQFEKYSKILSKGNVVKVIGKVDSKEDEKTKILVSSVENITKTNKIYIKLPKGMEKLTDVVYDFIKETSDEYFGSIPVYFFEESTKKIKLVARNYYLDDSENVMDILRERLGKENVIKKSN